MAFNFPNNPVENQEFTAPGGPNYVYRSPRWLATAASGTVINLSANVLWPNVAAASAAYLPSSVGMIETQAFGVALTEGGATYSRASLAAITAGGYPASARFQSQDRFMPDGSTDNINGGYWLLDENRVNPFMFGGTGDGVADDTTEINDAVLYTYKRSIGGEVDMAGGRWLVDSGDIVMRSGVTLKGTWRSGGELANADIPSSVPTWDVLRTSTIELNPLYTIRMNDDACGVEGMQIFRKNLPFQNGGFSVRKHVDAVKANFTGKAITIGSGVAHQGAEAYVGYCFIVGFQYAIHSSQAGRVHIEWVSGDCLNGIYMDNSLDMQHMAHCHFWPFYGRVSNHYNITGVANNGSGGIRLTVSGPTDLYGLLDKTNPARIYVQPDDISTFTNGMSVSVAAINDPVMAAAVGAGPRVISNVTPGIGSGSFELAGVNCSGGAASEAVTLTVPGVGTPVITGDIITVTGVTGTTEANGKWTATRIDATHIDLQGSTFTNAYVSGGSVCLSTYLLYGVGYDFYDFIDWAQADTCFEYGWNIGFRVRRSGNAILLNCGSDGPASTINDPTLTGFLLEDSNNAKMVGCKAAGQAYGVVVDAFTTTYGSTPGAAALTGCDIWGIQIAGVRLKTGPALLTGSTFFNMPNAVVVDPGSTGITAVGNKGATILGSNAVAGSGGGMRRSTFMNNAWADITVGEREILQPSNLRIRTMGEYTGANIALDYELARGTPEVMTPALAADALRMRLKFWDGVSAFQYGAGYQMRASATASPTSSPGGHIWSTTSPGSIALTDRLSMFDTALYPTAHYGMTLGNNVSWFSKASVGHLGLADGYTAPATIAGQALIYVDSADGDLKIKFGDGTVKTIVVDT